MCRAGLAPLEGRDAGLTFRALRRGRGGVSGVAQPGLTEVGGVGESGRLTTHDADARAALAARHEFLDLAVVEARRRGATVLREHLGEVTAVA